MKFDYRLSDETTIELEVTEEVAAFITESDRKQENRERNARSRKTRRVFSLDAMDFEGLEIADENTPESLLLREEENALMEEALETLTETQRRRLMMAIDMSVREIAASEHTAVNAAQKSLTAAREKILNFFERQGVQNAPKVSVW